MQQEETSPIVPFITWKPSYDCIVELINCQHQGILRFINAWYTDISSNRITQYQSVDYMRKKFTFLELFCDTHFAFEDTLLQILLHKFKFPQQVFDGHLRAHSKFVNNFMKPLEAQVDIFEQAKKSEMVENLVSETLYDVARWWYNHIRDMADAKRTSYDHYYRLFIERLPEKDKIVLFNDLIMFVEKCPQQFSCSNW